jgi:signal transduction histidine kinase
MNLRASIFNFLENNPLKWSASRLIIIFTVFAILVNLLFVIWRGYSSYGDARDEARTQLEKLVHTIGDHVELTILAVDVVLKRVVEKNHFNMLFGKSLNQDTQNSFVTWVEQTPQISAILMTDETGKISAIYRKYGYKPWMKDVENVSDATYFKVHKDEIDKLYIGKQESFIRDHDGFILMSRRIDKLDGSFGGVVLAAINADYLKNFFMTIEKNRKTDFIVRLKSGIDLINPIKERAGRDSFLIQFNKFNDYIYEDTNSVSFVEDKFNEGIKIYSFYDIINLDIVVSLVSYSDRVLKNWREDRYSDALFFILFILFTSFVAYFSIQSQQQAERAKLSERQALAASNSKSEFLANMSHELRTPLNAIIGFSEMIVAGFFGKVNDKQKERLNDIHSCGNHLLAIINDILEFSKGQAGKMELSIEDILVPKLVTDSIRIFDEKARRENKTIVSNIPKEIPPIKADRRKLKQILINLISNSVKFSEKGDIIEVGCLVNDKGEFVFFVKDNGIGMSEDDIPKALSAFGQVHKDQAFGGTGLGLPLCKVFAELHHGELKITSQKNIGTEVQIILPSDVILEQI